MGQWEKRKEKEKRSHNFTASKPASRNGFIGRLNIHPCIGGICWLPVATVDLISTPDLELQI